MFLLSCNLGQAVDEAHCAHKPVDAKRFDEALMRCRPPQPGLQPASSFLAPNAFQLASSTLSILVSASPTNLRSGQSTIACNRRARDDEPRTCDTRSRHRRQQR